VSGSGERAAREGKGRFATTHWSVVLKARSSDDGESRDALAVLCQAYWSPVFLYIKQRGHDAEAARDLTQGFFAALLEKKGIAEARQERGRFRTFLLTAVKNFLANEHDFRTAQKRGGGQAPISIEADEWNATMAIVEPATHLTPEVLYEKRWTLALLDGALRELEKDAERSGGVDKFRKLSGYLGNDEHPPYRALALDLDMTETGVRVALHRLRQRYGAKVREQVAQTLDDPAKIEDELRYLISLMRS